MIKKLIHILTIFIILGNPVSAKMQEGYLEYGGFSYKFKSNDAKSFITQANKNMFMFENSLKQQDKNFYLNEAMRYYFMLSKVQVSSIDAQVGLGRVYDEMHRDIYAKKHFFVAVDLNPKNAAANFHFANFYYKRSDLITALFYYKRAFDNGYQNKFEVNYRIGEIYEKLADLESAKAFYANAYKLKPDNDALLEKIQQLGQSNYSESQYYLFKK